MRGQELVIAVLEAHRTGKPIQPYRDVVIEPLTGYRGSIAVTGYRHWRAVSHVNRPRVGLFDVKVTVRGEPIEHERSVIVPVVAQLPPAKAEAVFRGESLEEIRGGKNQRLLMAVLQAAMVEQEVNWGNEPFQCKTFFAPPTRKARGKRIVTSRPRDLLMGYIRKCYSIRGNRKWSRKVESEIRSFLSSCREHRAGRSAALMPQMKGEHLHPEWESFHEDPSGEALPWLWGDVLEEFRAYAVSAPANPRWRGPTQGP